MTPPGPHQLLGHPLLTRDALAALATRLPETSMEYNLDTLPVGLDPDVTPANGLSAAETIRSIDENQSWIVLKNIERDPAYGAYGALLDSVLAELAPLVTPKTGPMVRREAFLFLSSPGSVTPFHMDPEHNILLQIEGRKVMNLFPAGDPVLVLPTQSEAFHAGGHRNPAWDEAFRDRMDPVTLTPGDAVLVPVKAPHFVQNGDRVSISLSITWHGRATASHGSWRASPDVPDVKVVQPADIPPLQQPKRPLREIHRHTALPVDRPQAAVEMG
jgi:hypothetical protein